MRTITIIYDGTLYTYRWIKALFWAKAELKQLGYSIRYASPSLLLPNLIKQKNPFLYGISSKNLDIVFLAFHDPWRPFGNDVQKGLALIKEIRGNCKNLVWLDTQDSTGTPNFEVLPYVDLYLKKQLLADETLYEGKIYGSRIFADYLHHKLNLRDDVLEFDYTLLDHKYIGKLGLSWNIGVADYYGGKGRSTLLRPLTIKYPHFQQPGGKRDYDFHFNGGTIYRHNGIESPLVSFQRKKLVEQINSTRNLNHPGPIDKINHEEYIHGVSKSKAMFSPFGWGEICLRDFESMIYGNTLLKPNVEHLATWPNFFIANETYIPMDWELNDFHQVLEEIGSKRYMLIATEAQELFKKYTIGEDARRLFANHIADVLNGLDS